MTKTRRGWLVLTAAAAAVVLGCAPAAKAPSTSTPSLTGTVGASLVTMTARVRDLDQVARVITLEQPGGKRLRFRVGDEVRNIAQVRVGDEVTVTYYESLAYAVRKPGAAQPGAAVTEELRRAALGEKPAGSAARVTTVTATISGIDEVAGIVTLQGPDGGVVTVKARHPEHLRKVAIGDRVDVTYSEALAVSVETPAR